VADWIVEWLLIHVPEDDLPARFLPGNYATGVTFSSGDLPMEYAAKRMDSHPELSLALLTIFQDCLQLVTLWIFAAKSSPSTPEMKSAQQRL